MTQKEDKRKGKTLPARTKSEPKPRISEGEYTAECIRHDIAPWRGTEEKLYLYCKITEGQYSGIELYAAYNYKYENFSPRTKYYTDWSIANGGLPSENEEMSPDIFLKKTFIVKVRDSKPRYDDGSFKPDMFRYSVIDRIVQELIW